MAVRKFKPTTPGQRHKIIGILSKKLLHEYQKSLLYLVRNLLVVVTILVK